MKPTIAGLVGSIGELSALPDTWQRIDAVLALPSASIQQIADAVATDPGMAVRLLRLANSPLYGFSQRVDRVTQAVHLIGTRQLRELALAATVVDMLSGGTGRRERLDAFLQRSTATALAARALAARRREANSERYFVLGLLHDIGAFILEMADPVQAAQDDAAARAQCLPIERVEYDRMGFDHAGVGAALLERWRLPAAMVEPVQYHHHPLMASTRRIEAATVHVAMVMVGLSGIAGASAPLTPLVPGAWDQLGLAPDIFAEVDREVETALASTIAILTGRGA